MRRPWSLVLLSAALSCGDADPGEPMLEAATATASVEPTQAEEEEGTTGVRELKDGLIVETTVGGRGHAAQNGDRLRIHYEGRVTESGTVFASTRSTGIPYSFVLGRKEVIPAWELALRGARAGSEHKLTVPASLAYAEKGMGAVPPDAALEFDVKVVAVEGL